MGHLLHADFPVDHRVLQRLEPRGGHGRGVHAHHQAGGFPCHRWAAAVCHLSCRLQQQDPAGHHDTRIGLGHAAVPGICAIVWRGRQRRPARYHAAGLHHSACRAGQAVDSHIAGLYTGPQPEEQRRENHRDGRGRIGSGGVWLPALAERPHQHVAAHVHQWLDDAYRRSQAQAYRLCAGGLCRALWRVLGHQESQRQPGGHAQRPRGNERAHRARGRHAGHDRRRQAGGKTAYSTGGTATRWCTSPSRAKTRRR